MRQVLPVSDVDYRLVSEPITRKRFSTWHGAWKRLLEMVELHEHWEWWLEEDLVKQKATGLRFSQICARCELWGVGRMAPDQTEPPECVRCGHVAAPRDQPIRTSPRSRSASAHARASAGVDPQRTVPAVSAPSADRPPYTARSLKAGPHTGPHSPSQPIDPADT